MIISLAGRKKNGKSELAKIAEKNGFQRMSFALPLKEMVANLLKRDVNFLNENKTLEVNFRFGKEDIDFLSRYSGLCSNQISKIALGHTCKTIRDVLQFVGSDIIRNIDCEWHIKKVKEKIVDGINYCFDDLRFPNEKAYLDSMDSLSFFVIRQREFDYDNHESETSLRWHDFDEFIINNGKDKISITKRFSRFINLITNPRIPDNIAKKTGSSNRIEFRKWLKKAINEIGYEGARDLVGFSMDSVNLWVYNLFIHRDRGVHKINAMAFAEKTLESSYFAGVLSADGCIKDCATNNNVILSLAMCDLPILERFQKFLETEKPIIKSDRKLPASSIFDLSVSNPFILENIKLWNIKPRKSQKEELPFLIQNDLDMIKAWIVGLIDGDGSICFGNQNNKRLPNLKPSIRVQILSSKEICEFLIKFIPIHHVVRPHKHTKLMEICFSNHYAVDFFNWLGRPDYGLERKWLKIKEFEEMKTSRRTPKNEFSN